jgi:hypothetical protein
LATKKPAVICDGRAVFGMQQVLQPYLDATLTKLDGLEAVKTPEEVT